MKVSLWHRIYGSLFVVRPCMLIGSIQHNVTNL